MKHLLSLGAAALLVPTLAFAAGSSDPEPPKPTETTMECAEGEVYNPDTKACEAIKSSALDNDQMYKAVRELAYAGRLMDASQMLDQMTEGETARVLTYRGFVARRMGDMASANSYYLKALSMDPDNILARSYMGQGLMLQGDKAGAAEQLAQIQARGGRGTWAEKSLSAAIASGITYSY